MDITGLWKNGKKKKKGPSPGCSRQEAEFKVSRSRVERVVSRKLEGLFLTGGGFNGKVSQEED